MSHPVVARLRELLPPPSSGGDTVDWEQIERTTGLAFPADYRELVELYGGGEIDEYLSVSTPPVPGSPYGIFWTEANPPLNGIARSWEPSCREGHCRRCCPSQTRQAAMSRFGCARALPTTGGRLSSGGRHCTGRATGPCSTAEWQLCAWRL